jgi:protein SCO1/2
MAKESARSNGRAARRAEKKDAAKAPGISKPLLIGAGAVFALVFGVFVAMTSNTPPAPPPSAIGGAFQLTTHAGEQVSESLLLGKPDRKSVV